MDGQNQEIVPGYCIRHARAADMARVGQIAREAWVRIHEHAIKNLGEELHEVLSPDWARRKESAVCGHWEQHPEWFHVVESVESREVVAFVTFSIDEALSMGRITNNGVAPEAQGSGIGSAMYAFVLDRFREAGLKYAMVGTGLDEGHAPARRAYEKAGFNIAREKVDYYMYLQKEPDDR